jgi:hypothetical protein
VKWKLFSSLLFVVFSLSASAYWQSRNQIAVSVAGCTPGAAATTVLAKTVSLDATHTTAYCNLINGLVADGIWTTDGSDQFKGFYLLATQDTTNALLDLTSNGNNLIANGSPSFTADGGYTGVNGSSTVYLDTQIGGNAFGSTSAAHMSLWSLTTGQLSNGSMGVQNNGVAFSYIYPRFTDDHMYGAVHVDNAGDANDIGADNTDGTGHYLVSRSDATTVTVYKNGVSKYSYSANGSNSYTVNVQILGLNFQATGHSGTAVQAAAATVGTTTVFDATKTSNLYNRLRTYMTAVGVP